jgi:Acetyltransferase (isoleucine patch superfamily)
MDIKHIAYQSIFIIRFRYLRKGMNYLRTIKLRLSGMKIGKHTSLSPCFVTWPHQISIGENCLIEHGVYFHYDGIYSAGTSICIGNNVFIGNYTEFNITDKISVGDNCLIASGCKFIDHTHGFKYGQLTNLQVSSEKAIFIEEDVWLGCNVVVLKGVTIGKGAVVGASSLVNKSIPPYEIWGGVPAKKIGVRN